MKKLLFNILLLLLGFLSMGQTKTYIIKKVQRPPKIDGIIDPVWDSIPAATGFIQYEPFNGKPSTQKTVVKLAYTPSALYVLAINYDKPGKISAYLSPRDNTEQSDWFGIYIDPFDNGRLAYCFIITAAGVQVDKKIIGTSDDYSWDAVWRSRVKKTNFGWIAEFKIPFNQLRFPNKTKQTWSINFLRNIQRNREISSWNFMDIKQQSQITQMGKLIGLQNLRKTLHLELYPYTSFYIEKWSDRYNLSRYYNGGMDLKLGMGNNLTLDMMLIPDFGEVLSDDPVLNLSPYETYYAEKRQFFTEGTEIFKLGNIFYSRRIGGRPSKYSQVQNLLEQNEVIINNPPSTQIINATKITGKTKSKITYGILNALTDNTYALVCDTVTGEERKILTEPLTNYNVLAMSKDLNHGSYIGLINTNKTILTQGYYSANVSALDLNLKDNSETYRLFMRLSSSLISPEKSLNPEFGYAYQVTFSKTKGNFKFGLSRSLYSDKYYINDMGFLQKNNIITHNAYISYFIYKPVWIIRKWKTKITFTHQALFKNYSYIGTQIKIESYGTLKNLSSIGVRINLSPDKTFDYFEPRVENFVYIIPPMQNYMMWYSTDYARKIAFDLQTGFYLPIENKSTQKGGWILLGPRLRLGNWGLFVYHLKAQLDQNDYGYVGTSDNQDTVIFGQRNIRVLENTINMELSFSPTTHLVMRARHYWSLVKYLNYFALTPDGQLILLPFSYHYTANQDQNFNTINLEAVFKWQFLPGSELSIVLRRQLNSSSKEIIPEYVPNLRYVNENFPTLNTLIIKLVLYI